MTTTLLPPRTVRPSRPLPAIVGDMGLEDASPFGLQGLKRDIIEIVKPDCIGQLAVALALRGSPAQIRDPQFVHETLHHHPDWIDEYRVVHLIEKSLWINGHSDLVMTLIKNPSQIPDNPPPAIQQMLSRAYALHPTATIWYGVPLFSDQQTPEGLPIPLAAAEVRAEAQERLEAAQRQALKCGWSYRLARRAAQVPARCVEFGRSVRRRIQGAMHAAYETYRQARRDSRKRAIAAIKQELEHARFGRCWTEIPPHKTATGRAVVRSLEALFFTAHITGYALPIAGTATLPMMVASVISMSTVPMVIVATDPFLFLELPEEPGKLRHLGHWYWQDLADGKRKLHLHT
jgi:hypothetical protein